jgi:hypothetical protein
MVTYHFLEVCCSFANLKLESLFLTFIALLPLFLKLQSAIKNLGGICTVSIVHCNLQQAELQNKSWVRIPRGAWIFVCCECRVLSGRGLCDELITRPEESYILCCIVVCDLETSRIGAPYMYMTLVA